MSNADEIIEYISKSPNCTYRDVVDNIGLKTSTVTARLSEMVKNGRILITGRKNVKGMMLSRYSVNHIWMGAPKGAVYLKMDGDLLNVMMSVDTWSDDRFTSFFTQDEGRPHVSRFKGDGYDLVLYQYAVHPKIVLNLEYYSRGLKLESIKRVRSFPSHQTFVLEGQQFSVEVRAK